MLLFSILSFRSNWKGKLQVHMHLVSFHLLLLLCYLIGCLWLTRFCLGHGHICWHFLPLSLFEWVSCLAGATSVGRGCCFHRNGGPAQGQMGVFSNVDGQVGVQRLKLFGKQLIGQRVKAVRAPIEPGPFQKVKPRMTKAIFKIVWRFHPAQSFSSGSLQGGKDVYTAKWLLLMTKTFHKS